MLLLLQYLLQQSESQNLVALPMTEPTAGGSSPPEKFPVLSSNIEINRAKQLNHYPVSFASILKPKTVQPNFPTITMKPVTMLHRDPNITWKSSEVKTLIAKENL